MGGVRVELSMVREMSLLFLVRDLGPMMTISDLSQFSLRKLFCIQDHISVRQMVRVERDVKLDIVLNKYYPYHKLQ